MKKVLSAVPLVAVLLATACDEATSPLAEVGGGVTEVVVTQGIPAPIRAARPFTLSNSDLAEESNLGGSEADAVSLKPTGCDGSQQSIQITYTVTGRQENPASFEVNTVWTYNGSSWTGSSPTTVSIPPRAAADPPTSRPVTVTVVNGSSASTGTSSFIVSPMNVVSSAPAALNVANGNSTIHVEFVTCGTANTAPTIVVPADLTIEATSAAGATVHFVVTASDLEDGDLTSAVQCTPASGSVFALGTTAVNCSVTDNGGLSDEGSFNINVVDTTPPLITGMPSSPQNLIAANISGATVDFSAVMATDLVDGVVPVTCTRPDPASAGSTLPVAKDIVTFPIGTNTTVTCAATDQAGNPASPTVDIVVTLDLSSIGGFLTPLRVDAPFSAHKRGSAIPHKFPAPKYADGTLATDLAAGLNLTLQRIAGTSNGTTLVEDEPGAGSTAWRYDADAGHYIFNVKSLTSWADGQWQTTASYAGVKLAETEFGLRK